MNQSQSRQSGSSTVFIALMQSAVWACLVSFGIDNVCAQAWVIDIDTVIDAHSEIPNHGIEIIDGDQPTVVDIVEGGDVSVVRRGPTRTRTSVLGSSILNVVGGHAQDVTTFDLSTLNIVSGGVVSWDGTGISARGNRLPNCGSRPGDFL